MMMQVVTAVVAARAVSSSEDSFRDEKCTCSHEDHTPGNGCERRLCTCRFWPTED